MKVFLRRPRADVGFTLIEVVVAIALLAMIFSFSFGVGSNFYGSQVLVAERDNLLSLLRSARSLAVNNVDQSSHGVFVSTSTSQYAIFEGNSYASRNQSLDVYFPISYGAVITGLAEVVFSALDGKANVSGTIIISTSIGSSTITLNNEGRINW
jgi:prepilin-type N-terminal cleavage/methylation domain-containing protein